MVKITNHTKRVVTVYNDIFSVNLDIDETAQISEDVLNRNPEFYVRYLSLKEAKKETEFDLKKDGIRFRTYLHFEIKTLFPVITVLNLENVSEVELKEDDVVLRSLLLIKTVCLKRILCKCDQVEPDNMRFLFLNEDDKAKFLKMMRLGTAITLPIAILATLSLILYIFSNCSVWEKIFVSLFFLGVALLGFSDLYYTVKAKKWEIEKRK